MLELKYTLDGAASSIPLFDGHYVIGRGKACDVVIKDPSVSGQHLRLEVQGEVVSFRDLHSSNGTFLNKVKVDSGTLRAGDTLKLGKVKLRVRSDQAMFDPIGGGEPDEGAEVTPDAEFESFNAPEPDMFPAVIDASPAAQERAVAVIVPKSVQQGADGDDAAKRKRLLVLGGAVGVALLLFVVLKVLQSEPPQNDGPKRMTFQDDYWPGMVRGVELFNQGEVREAIETWRSVENRFNDEKEKGERPDMMVGRTFAESAQLLSLTARDDVPDINWSQLRSNILDLLDQNLLRHPTLEAFAQRLEAMCRQEHANKQIYDGAEQALRSQNWVEAREQALQIPSTSVYHRFVDPILARVSTAQLREIRDEAMQQGRNRNFRRAIQLANRYMAEGGSDSHLQESVQEWERELVIMDAIQSFVQRHAQAQSPAEIETVLQLGAQLEEQYPTHGRVLDEVRPRIREMNQRVFLAKVKEAYDAGDEEGLRELRAEIFANELAEARAYFQKQQQLKDMLARAEETEGRGRFEEAIAIWQQVTETEPNSQNFYHQQAALKIRAYSPDRLAQMYMQAAQAAVQRSEFFLARQLLQRAESNGANTTSMVDSIHQIGRRKFTEAVNAHQERIFVTRHMEVNLALDCFLPGEDFYTRILTRMEQWNETRRQPRTMDD